LKVNDENSRIRIQDPNPDPSVRGMDPRIRIHSKMSWIRNTAFTFVAWIFTCTVWQVDSNMKLGEWAGLCKIDQEGKARKVGTNVAYFNKKYSWDYFVT
jgi:hypothetical protein